MAVLSVLFPRYWDVPPGVIFGLEFLRCSSVLRPLSFCGLVSMTSVFIEKRTLELRREISLQYYQTDVNDRTAGSAATGSAKAPGTTLADPYGRHLLWRGTSAAGTVSVDRVCESHLQTETPSTKSRQAKVATDESSALLRFSNPFGRKGLTDGGRHSISASAIAVASSPDRRTDDLLLADSHRSPDPDPGCSAGINELASVSAKHVPRSRSARPGEILDRNGYVLAMTVTRDSLYAIPDAIDDYWISPGASAMF